MIITITGRSKEHLEDNLNRVLNIVTCICSRGSLPRGQVPGNIDYSWWYKENDRYNLFNNDYWMNIVEEGTQEGNHYIELRFNSRYFFDKVGYEKTLCEMLVVWFEFVEIEVYDEKEKTDIR